MAWALGVWVTAQAAAPVITNITLVGAAPQFRVQSDLGITNQIQYATNVGQINWTVLTNVVVTNSPYWFVDVAAPPAPYRFYRVAALYQTNNPVPPGMALIPAGSFTMGDSLDGDTEALPLHSVYVSAFYMDKYDVTYSLWQQVYNWAITHGYSFDYADSGQGKAANHPAHRMTWYDAVKWCNARSEKENKVPAYYTDAGLTTRYRSGQVAPYVNWGSGYRLPTEAEWEKAARGGASGRRFPWSGTDNITHGMANYQSTTNDAYDTSLTRGYHPTFAVPVANFPYTSPVGYFATNGFGLYDMAGNVWQWCWDWYSSSYYGSSPASDPRGPATGPVRVGRGGGWYQNAILCREANRYGSYPSYRNFTLGFRSVLPLGQ